MEQSAQEALRFLADQSLALDVLQETFLYLLSKFPGFKLTARLTTFLYPAVKNLSIAQRRKAKRFASPGDAAESGASILDQPCSARG